MSKSLNFPCTSARLYNGDSSMLGTVPGTTVTCSLAIYSSCHHSSCDAQHCTAWTAAVTSQPLQPTTFFSQTASFLALTVTQALKRTRARTLEGGLRQSACARAHTCVRVCWRQWGKKKGAIPREKPNLYKQFRKGHRESLSTVLPK